MIYKPNFMKIGVGIEKILRFRLSNFGGCNVGITDGGICDVRSPGGLR
jgi:hypothetical protein